MSKSKAPQNLVTIYSNSEFSGSINKYEGKLVEASYGKYAQYDNAPKVVFIPKGKRNPRGFRKCYGAEVLVLQGVGHPEPQGMYGEPLAGSSEHVTIRQARHMSFSEGWASDFNAIIDPYLAANPQVKVILDARTSKGFNPNYAHSSVQV